MIRLYTTFYHEKNSYRRKEYISCLRRNLDCEAIDQVIIFNENGDLSAFRTGKLTVIPKESRPTYGEFFDMINQITTDSDINIIANTDIFFPQNISVLNQLTFNDKCFALSRWNTKPDGTAVLFDRNDSQDVWVFKGKIKRVRADFCIGRPRCDNRIAHELEKAGYRVENPSFSIKSFHLHAGERGEYSEVNQPYHIPPPYKYIWPHNLLSLPGTLLHNVKQPYARVSYRIDMRKINQWIVIRGFRKVAGVIRSRKSGQEKSTYGS